MDSLVLMIHRLRKRVHPSQDAYLTDERITLSFTGTHLPVTTFPASLPLEYWSFYREGRIRCLKLWRRRYRKIWPGIGFSSSFGCRLFGLFLSRSVSHQFVVISRISFNLFAYVLVSRQIYSIVLRYWSFSPTIPIPIPLTRHRLICDHWPILMSGFIDCLVPNQSMSNRM